MLFFFYYIIVRMRVCRRRFHGILWVILLWLADGKRAWWSTQILVRRLLNVWRYIKFRLSVCNSTSCVAMLLWTWKINEIINPDCMKLWEIKCFWKYCIALIRNWENANLTKVCHRKMLRNIYVCMKQNESHLIKTFVWNYGISIKFK